MQTKTADDKDRRVARESSRSPGAARADHAERATCLSAIVKRPVHALIDFFLDAEAELRDEPRPWG